MADNSRIDYVDATINPLGWGCYGPHGTAEDPNPCPWCYAHRLAKRNLRDCPDCRAFVPHWHPQELDKLAHWKRPRRIFVQSMGDLFGAGVDLENVYRFWQRMVLSPQHTFLLLTKSPQGIGRFFDWWRERQDWLWSGEAMERFGSALSIPPYLQPTRNVWLGTSVTNQADADERIPLLRQVPAAVRWLSIEPLLGPVDLWKAAPPDDDAWEEVHAQEDADEGYHEPEEFVEECEAECDWVNFGHDLVVNPEHVEWERWGLQRAHSIALKQAIGWVVIGAQTGPGAVAPKWEWITSLIEQCDAAGVPLWIKDNVGWPEKVREVPNEGA